MNIMQRVNKQGFSLPNNAIYLKGISNDSSFSPVEDAQLGEPVGSDPFSIPDSKTIIFNIILKFCSEF